VRKVISDRMSESKKDIPHINLRIKVNAANMIRIREQIKEKSKNGLVVPTIFKCNELSLSGIAKKRNELVLKAREGRLSLNEIINGTFTITNLGMYGIRSSTPIINPPQSSIVAIGEIYSEPAILENEISIGSFLEITLASDHRVIDGEIAALFLKSLKEKIENPLNLIVG